MLQLKTPHAAVKRARMPQPRPGTAKYINIKKKKKLKRLKQRTTQNMLLIHVNEKKFISYASILRPTIYLAEQKSLKDQTHL